ncbi:MAG TPA: NAD-dependent epimerase/dehydratase family protein [Mariprofundaceae bacterium]|nr:NAD-dependent epimerase/dehydratase family protein [Mariprofundaceae bacterium]
MTMHTILGAGGVIGRGLALELRQYAEAIRLVSRHPKPVHGDEECVTADLTDAAEVEKALAGSKVAYLVAGLQYDIRVWQEQWPLIMENAIAACKRHGCKLVFFDNVYPYGLVDGPMTEETPFNPCSKKGEVRTRIAERLMNAVAHGEIEALIARSADFYGPGTFNTFVQPMVFDKLQQGKKAAWLCDDRLPHSMTFTPDAARAVALLGNADDAFGKTWHLPTAANPPTGREFIELVAKALDTEADYRLLKPWMLRLVGLFNPLVRESMEMLYQLDHPYIFDSSKFEARFFRPTTYAQGIGRTVTFMRCGSQIG